METGETKEDEDVEVLYHEKQVASLCGMHCLNALLQGPAFNDWDLGLIALEMDREERELMAKGGLDADEYVEFLSKQGERSENVSSDGNFSLQVLQRALDVWGLRLSPLQEISLEALMERKAFLCFGSSHWFAIRKVGNEWYNFNSKLPAPAQVEVEELLAYLVAMIGNPHQSVFDVFGNLSCVKHEQANDSGMWTTPQDARNVLQHEPPETFDEAWSLGPDPEPVPHHDGEGFVEEIISIKVHASEDLFVDMETSRKATMLDLLNDACHVFGLDPKEYDMRVEPNLTTPLNLEDSLEEHDIDFGKTIHLVKK